MPASIPASSPSRLPHNAHAAAQGSSSSSSPSRAGPGAAHDSWVRNYESVEYEIPLLDPHGQLDSSGDEDDEAENISGGMHSQTDQPPPRTPPKNPSLSPKRDGNASAEPRSHSRKPSSISSASPSSPTPQYRNFSPPTPMTRALRASASENDKDQGGVVRDGQIAARAGGSGGGSASAGVSGSPRIPNTGSVMTDISHQSSLSSPTTTAVLPTSTSTPSTPTPPPPASRSPRSSSFKSSPLAASVSVLSGANNNNTKNPTTTSGSNSSSLFSNPNSSTSAPAMNVSSSMSNPHSVGNSSSSSSSTPPSSFFQSGQGSSSGQNLPSMPNTPYSQYAHGHPNPNSPPFAKQGTRPSMNHNNNNNGHMNPAAYPQPPRITSGNNDETRALVGEGGSGSGRASPLGSGFMPTATALRDPPPPAAASMTNNHLYGHHPPGNANHPPLTSSGSRGSMILYRLSANEDGTLPPPGVPAGRRTSVYSNSGDSIVSLSGDSKYPLVGFGNGHGGSGTRTPGTPGRPGTPGTPNNGSIGNRGGELSMSEIGRVHGGLVAYMYDPGQDLDADELDEEEEEWVKMVGGHVPRSPRGGELKGFGSFGNANVRMDMSGKNGRKGQHGQQGPGIRTSKHTPPPTGGIPWRGLINVSTLILLIIGLLALFLLYPVWRAYNNNGVEQLILGNTRINSTGQAVNEAVVPLNNREWRLPGFDRELQ